jgi:fibronectin type 3 domain-containing protein
VSRSATTDSSGRYTFASLPKGSYIVAPSKSGYTFTPPTASVSINTASVTGVNFAGKAAATPLPHTVTLSWNASTSANIKGYNVYRATVAGGSYAKVNPSLLTATAYVDSGVSSGRTYYYVTTAVNSSNAESGYSNQAAAVVPSP